MENYLKVSLDENRLPLIKALINGLLAQEGVTDITLNNLTFGDDCLHMSYVKSSGEEITPSEKHLINERLTTMGIVYYLRD